MKNIFKGRFSSFMYSWGPNMNNLGRSCSLSENHFTPASFNLEETKGIAKVISGYSESLVLTEDKQLFSFGHSKIISKNTEKAKLFQQNILDADIDSTHAAYLFLDGSVVVESNGSQKIFNETKGVKALACGSEETFLVTAGSENDQLFSLQYINDDSDFHRSYRIKLLNSLLEKKRARVVKIRAAGGVGVMLLDDGSLYTWGNNEHGNLGIPSSVLRKRPQEVYSPQEPMSIANIDSAVADFSLSVNVLAVLTDQKRVFYSGFGDTFLLKELILPLGEVASKIGSWESNLAVVTNDGNLYTRFHFEEDEKPVRFYGELRIFKIGSEYFDNKRLVEINGKYANSIAVCI